MFHVSYVTRPDNYVSLSCKNWIDKSGNVVSVVLIIGIRVDDDVGPKFDTSIQSHRKCTSKSLVGRILNYVPDTNLPGNPDSIVDTSIINNKHFDLIDTLYV